jgi:hypothetical protein
MLGGGLAGVWLDCGRLAVFTVVRGFFATHAFRVYRRSA